MCVRFAQAYTWQELYGASNLIRPSVRRKLMPRYNITRRWEVDVVIPEMKLSRMVWEFVPEGWSKPLKEKKFSTFDSKCETVDSAKTFAPAWKKAQRCIIPASMDGENG